VHQGALHIYGKPEIFNSDPGSRFTSVAFTDILKREGVGTSMDGRGRALDNLPLMWRWPSVKQEVYLKGYNRYRRWGHDRGQIPRAAG
jgi:putative transposase